MMDEFLQEFKDGMKISNNSEDEHLKKLLNTSYDDIVRLVGEFDPKVYLLGRELVLNRARYVYNDSLEFFYDNFQQTIIDLSLDLSGSDEDGN